MSSAELVVAVPYEPHGFNEVLQNYTGGGGYYVANNIFNRLVTIDVFGGTRIRPDLAERWEVLDGGTTYRFHLRDARWHDGMPLSAEDVRVTYLTAIREGYRAAASLGDVRDIVVRDQRIVDIQLHRPNSGFLAQLSIFVWTHILPAHLYSGTDWASNPANEQPVGTGPFRFEEWRRGESVRLVANPDYHHGRVALDAVEFRVLPDIDEALELLSGGEVDFCTQNVPCERYDEMAATRGVAVAQLRGNALGHLTFNLDRSPWSDQRVREAVARVIDRTALAGAVCSRARPAQYAYLEHIKWAFNPSAKYPSYDPGKAIEFLEAAGLQADQDGVRLRARLVCRDLFRQWRKVALEIAPALATIGIVVQVDSLDAVEWNGQVQVSREFDLLIDGLGIGPDPVLFEEVLGSNNVLNTARYANPELDELFRTGKAVQTRAARAAAYKAAQTVIARDMPRIHLLRHGNHLAYRSRWAGWSWDPGVQGTLPVWSVERVHPRG